MAASCKPETEKHLAELKELGLMTGHTYGVIDAFELDHEGKTL